MVLRKVIMTTYFISDLHLYHTNIIRYCNRPFSSVGEMHETILNNYNSVVRSSDTVYFIGDIIFGHGKLPPHQLATLQAFGGRKHLIYGNHDSLKVLREHFESVSPYLEIKVPYVIESDKKREHPGSTTVQQIVLCHYPFQVWNRSHYGSWHLHGHCHGTLPPDSSLLRLDVGVDPNNFRPLSFNDIAEIMATKTFVPISDRRAM